MLARPILHIFKYFRDESLAGGIYRARGRRLFSASKMKVLRGEINSFARHLRSRTIVRELVERFRLGLAADFHAPGIYLYSRREKNVGDKSCAAPRTSIPRSR